MMDIRNRIIRLRYIKASELSPHPQNWRKHPKRQADALRGVLSEIGWVDAALFNVTTGRLIDGHLRRDIAGDAMIPVLDVELTEDEERAVLLTFDPISAMAETEAANMKALMDSLEMENEAISAMLENMRSDITYSPPVLPKSKRILAIDAIYTLQGADCSCCMAVQAGLKYGIQSASYSLCPYHDKLSGRHKVTFIDNDYFNYDHAKHLAAVKELRPKYATVRDVMSVPQCDKDKIAYYELSQILAWADELAEYAENVIVIPKFDCLDQIPERFVLGYSVPSSHGGTPLPIEAFEGRRVHLLGGSWKKQLEYLKYLGSDVVSIDNNQIQIIAKQWGQFIDPEGNTQQIKYIAPTIPNVRYAALTLSFGAISAKIQELTEMQNDQDIQD